MSKTITRKTILQDAFEAFQQISQWLPNHIDTAAEYSAQAKALVELLEVHDCGSVGGYDRTNPNWNPPNGDSMGHMKRITGFALYDRFLALLAKYPDDKLVKCCQFSPKTLGDYFKTIVEQREKS